MWTARATRTAIQGRIEQIKHQIAETESDYDKEKLQERLAKLSGGVAVVQVGAATETELKEKKARIEDAMHATRAAVEEGIVPGGGVALLNAQSALDSLKLEGDEQIGLNIVRRAIEEPLRQISENAGQEGSVVVNEVKTLGKGHGYNAATGEYGDLIAQGVVDPAKVVRTALQNAASIAGLILTTECLISEKAGRRARYACEVAAAAWVVWAAAWAACTEFRACLLRTKQRGSRMLPLCYSQKFVIHRSWTCLLEFQRLQRFYSHRGECRM